MSMTAAAIRFYTDSERLAYQKIDGMKEVLRATPSELEDISTKYPDAMFAIMIHEEMVCRVAGIRNIVRKAHAAILKGEGIAAAVILILFLSFMAHTGLDYIMK